MSNGHIIPGWVKWETSMHMHTPITPFCNLMECMCHYEQANLEYYFIQPIERGELSIAEAIDLYHCEPGYMARQYTESKEVVLV